jgi:hypothetical protein
VRFLVPRVSLIKLLKAVCSGAVPLLRIEASAGFVTLSCGDIEAGCEATVERSGVCFLRHSKLKKLIQTYHSDAGHSATIDIEVRPSGIRVGRTKVSRAGWEISLFANPASAPKTLRFRSPKEENEPSAESQMLLPFAPTRTTPPDTHGPPESTTKR